MVKYMSNNKKKLTNTKLQKNKLKSYSKGSKSIVTNIYTYSNKKPKRLGKTCIHFEHNKLTCKLTKNWCNNPDECMSYVTNLKEINEVTRDKSKNRNINIVGITTIILNDNRKCTNNKHDITDLDANIRIAQPDGEILIYKIPAAYCKECDTYFVLKRDFKIAKSKGKILCPIIDLTKEGVKKNKSKNLSSSESRIHQLGYNVQRGSNYTKEQRQLILANIMENTNISKHEIESCIIRPMSQHKNQHNYADAVLAWQQDLEFVKNYKTGDIPEVVVDEIIVGKRK